MKPDRIARQVRAEIIVGVFLLLIFLGMGYATIILSRDTWFRAKQIYYVAFDNVDGLREGDGVVVRGMPVGKVRHLILTNNVVQVQVALDAALSLREGYAARIMPSSVLGGHFLEVEEGPLTNALLENVTLLQGSASRDLMTDAAEVVSELKDALIEQGILENVKVTTENLRRISERLEAGEGTLGRLLSRDDAMYTNLLATTESLRAVSGRLEAGEGTLGRLMAQDDKLYQDLSATMASLRSVTEKIDKGDGALGRLVSDEKMGQEVGEIVTEARAMVDDMRESTPVVTFTSIFFGAF